jgi:ribosomal protein L11 methylase PrmA
MAGAHRHRWLLGARLRLRFRHPGHRRGTFGCRAVAGVDIDPQAVEAARANAERNGVSALFADSAEPVAGEYDLVVANILSNPLRVLAPAICAHVRPGGCLALVRHPA